MIKIYHNNSCSKSRAAFELLKDKNLEFEIHEYLKNVPSKEELKEIIVLLNIKPFDLMRKNQSSFKEKYNQMILTDEEWIDVMLENPILIERPIVIKDGQAAIGRPIENIINLLK
ncbi:arsenate reductase (glutaredoxin) [Sphingobacterium daejeonense]|uniref:arsenate reductase (glutaredoxin) n=1 Tax=Sphingobacterium daejeonense TaxID=371142 RepID=UPI0010C4B6CE|nr:arsenate reductase (glutaredoxin) [Sphingobacterium daejeonense]VTQ00568.1 arsenate reductase [Sphingobacterium daejeonense]